MKLALLSPLVLLSVVSFAAAADDSKPSRFEPVRVIDVGDGKLQCVQFSPDGKHVAACGDKFVSMFDIESGKLVREFSGHAQDIFRLAFSHDGKYVASGSRDKTVHVWHVATGDVAAVLDEPTDRVIGVSFSADSRYLAAGVANYDGSIRVWDCETWQQVAEAKAPAHSNAMFVAFSPDGDWLATGEYRGGVTLYRFDGKSLRVKHRKTHDNGEMTPHVTFRPDGKAFLTSSWDRTIRLWDVDTGNEIWRRKTPPYARCFETSVFSPDGSLLFTVTRDETIQKRDGKTGRILATRRWNDEVRGLAISPDGKMLATGGHVGDIKLWSVSQFDTP